MDRLDIAPGAIAARFDAAFDDPRWRYADSDAGRDRAAADMNHWLDAVRPHLADRSEEHTSELQSLMRISYAVFCLKKQNALDATMSSSAATQCNSDGINSTCCPTTA